MKVELKWEEFLYCCPDPVSKGTKAVGKIKEIPDDVLWRYTQALREYIAVQKILKAYDES